MISNTQHTGRHHAQVSWRGLLQVEPQDLRHALNHLPSLDPFIEGWDYECDVERGLVHLSPKPNLVVDAGGHRSLDRLYGIGGPPAALQSMGVDDGASNPVAGTTDSTSGSTNRRIVLFDSTPVRTDLEVVSQGTFDQSNVDFVIKRLFLSAAAAGTTDSAGDLFSMTDVFTMDFTPFTTWQQTFQASQTATGS